MNAATWTRLQPYVGVADRMLFDAKPPKGSELPGGNGVSFDWQVLSDLDASVDYMLSGGLNAGNIGDALKATLPNGIDISSGRRVRAGRKRCPPDQGIFPGRARCQKRRRSLNKASSRKDRDQTGRSFQRSDRDCNERSEQ